MDRIVGHDACKAALTALLAEARADLAAKQDGDPGAFETAVTKWERELVELTQAFRPAPGENRDAIDALVEQADAAADAIRQAQVHDIIERIDERSREIEAAGSAFGAQALSNLGAAKRGRLLPIKNAIDSLTGTVNQIRTLKTQLDAEDRDEQKILDELEALIERFAAVKESVDAL